MLIVALISWWYSAGWLQVGKRLLGHLARVLDFFSIALLIKSLLAPYRQISVGRVRGPVDVQVRAWFDRLISRAIGAMVRLTVIGFGLVVVVLALVIFSLLFVAWPLVPLLPVIAISLLAGGM